MRAAVFLCLSLGLGLSLGLWSAWLAVRSPTPIDVIRLGPWQAWPNIGPFYPYPEVPLDWRAVTLRWDDGIWWLDFKKNYTRPFFTPYPFGLFAY